MSSVVEVVVAAAEIAEVVADLMALVHKQKELVDEVVRGLTPEERAAIDARLAASRVRKEEIRAEVQAADSGVGG